MAKQIAKTTMKETGLPTINDWSKKKKMPAYNFQKQFAGHVRAGLKTQTIRAERKDKWRPKPGMVFRGYTGMRTKHCELLVEGVITSVLDIEIEPCKRLVLLDGPMLSLSLCERLAYRDGFATPEAMFDWFRENHGDKFSGILIIWRPTRYF